MKQKLTINKKSSVEEIKQRFDKDVERFSNSETGQIATVDAAISLEIITEVAKRIQAHASTVCDIGCGAGNYTIKMLSKLPNLHCTLIDLSKAMLDRAHKRVQDKTNNRIEIIQGDIRTIDLQNKQYDILLAGAILHHLRSDDEWLLVFKKLFNSTASGGCLMISDLITQQSTAVHNYMQEKYADYLRSIGGESYQAKVFDYIEKEDSPRSLNYQLDLLQKVGFQTTEILHKNICFAAYAGIKN